MFIKNLPTMIVRVFVIFAIVLACSMRPARPLHATPSASFVVTATTDVPDIAPGDGLCATHAATGSKCTLRAAIMEANARPGADLIQLPPGLYPVAALGTLALTDPAGVTIEANAAILVANRTIFHIQSGAQATIDGVTINNMANEAYFNEGALTLRNGLINQTAFNPSSGLIGIRSRGALTLTNFIIEKLPANSNAALIIDGDPTSSTPTKLENVTLRQNQATGVRVSGSNHVIDMVDSTIDQNSLGLEIQNGNHQVTIRNSTISHNTAGGIAVGAGAVEFPLSVSILNSTLSGNQGNSALRLASSDSQRVQVLLNNVTITNNDGGGAVGGLFAPNTSSQTPALSIKNSIIAGNTTFIPLVASGVAAPATASDCGGAMLSQGHNLFGSVDGCTLKGDTVSNIVGVNPLLGALADNGGATLTHALQAGSPALNTGDPAQPGSGGKACEAVDQLGVNRPLGVACDIGATEAPAATVNAPLLTTLLPTNTVAGSSTLALTLTGANFNANSRVRWQGVTVTPSLFTPTTLQATIAAAQLTTGKVVTVTVIDQGAGLLSNALPFTINNPKPGVTSGSPTQVVLNSSTLVVLKGVNFVPTSQVLMDGRFTLPTAFVNGQELRATIPASAAAPLGKEIRLTVRNPLPGGGTSLNGATVRVVQLTLGEGRFAGNLHRAGERSTLTLGWTHPVDWRLLAGMDLRLLDETDAVRLWLGFDETVGETGAIVLYDSDGAVMSLGFPSEATVLETPLGNLDLAASQIDAQPGTTVTVKYAFRFHEQFQGRTFKVEFSANDKEGNAQGFAAAGTLTVPATLFLPLVTR